MTRAAAQLQRIHLDRAAVLTALALASAVAQSPAASAQAWRFTYTISPTAAGQPMAGGEQVLDVAVWRGVARITVRSGALRSLTGERGTMLLRADDSTLVVINPVRREVLTGVMGDLGALMGGPASGAPIAVGEVNSTTRNLGRGETRLGYPIRRVELTQRYTLRLNAPGIMRELRTEQVVSLEMSRGIGLLDPGFRVFAEQFGRSLGLPDQVRRQLRAAERGIPAGFPVRSTTEGMTVSGSDTLRTTARAVLTDLRRDAVDTASFIMPEGYRVTEMGRLLGPRRRP